MDYVYCAVFSDKTAKFGRSVDLWKRLYAHDSDGKRFGRTLRSCFISPVFDSVRDERNLLEIAAEMLPAVSRESFLVDNVSDVGDVFQAAKVPYIFCEMSDVAFGPVIGQNSFSTDFDMVAGSGGTFTRATRKDRLESRIMKLIDTYSGAVTRSIFKNVLLNYPDDYVSEVLDDMMARGEIVKIAHQRSKCGFRYERP